MNKSAYEDMFHWVVQREAVRKAKESGQPYPWTEDPIIAKYRFCCVRREDDRVTRWIEENVRQRFADHPDLWLMMCACRQFNWPGTIEGLMQCGDAWYGSANFSPVAMKDALNSFKGKVFGAAYIITAPSTKGALKTDHVALNVLGQLWRDRNRIAGPLWGGDGLSSRPTRQPRLEEVHAKLKQYKGWGDFMAYQAVVDMRFTRLLRDAEDRDRWAAAGPGTVRGLNRLAGRPLAQKRDQYDALVEMRKLHPLLVKETGVEMDFSDVPNVLCETDKYLRVKNKEGEPKALYVLGRRA